MPFIIEARSEHFPSLYSTGVKAMHEVDKKKAKRFPEVVARKVAANEKRLRPGRRIILIRVSE